MRALALVLFAACSYEPRANQQPGDGTQGDGPPQTDAPETDAPPDAFVGPPPSACVTKWLAATPPLFSIPVFVERVGNVSINNGLDERDPFISSDGLQIYFSRVDGSNEDILTASRAQVGDPFSVVAVKTSLTDEGAIDSKVTMTGDDLIAFIATERGGGEGAADLWEARRTTAGSGAFDPMTQEHLAAINDGNKQLDPYISPDGLRLYLAAGNPQQIVRSSRATLEDNFSAPQPVTQLNGTVGDADPVMTADERVVLFTRRDAGGSTDLFYATRAERDQVFGEPQQVTFNSIDLDADPMISGDGCTVYFSSTRDAGTSDYDLFVTDMTP